MERWIPVVAVVVVAAVAVTAVSLALLVPKFLIPSDRSHEEWTAYVNGTGPWQLGLPFPVSTPGTSFDDWVRNVTVDGAATVRPGVTARGEVLLVEGSGNVTLRSRAVQIPMNGNRCCAEAYLDAPWTVLVNVSGGADRLPVWAPVGPVDAHVVYTAQSNYCGRVAEFRGPVAGGGWAELPGTDGAICQ